MVLQDKENAHLCILVTSLQMGKGMLLVHYTLVYNYIDRCGLILIKDMMLILIEILNAFKNYTPRTLLIQHLLPILPHTVDDRVLLTV